MHQLILILLLVFLSLAGCSDRAAETMVYETKEPVPEETADYDKEYRRTEDQVGFVKVTSKYYFTTPLIQDIAEGFVPLRDHAVGFGGNRNSAVSRYIPGDRGDVYLHDLTAADEWYSAQNGLIHIAADGKKERICVLPDCTVEDTCPHMQFYNMRGVYAAGCLYFVCPDTAIDGSAGPVSVPGFVLKYDIAEREMVKFMEIPAYEQVWCLTAADDVLYIAYQDFVSGDGFYAVDLADEGEIPAACRYRRPELRPYQRHRAISQQPSVGTDHPFRCCCPCVSEFPAGQPYCSKRMGLHAAGADRKSEIAVT